MAQVREEGFEFNFVVRSALAPRKSCACTCERFEPQLFKIFGAACIPWIWNHKATAFVKFVERDGLGVHCVAPELPPELAAGALEGTSGLLARIAIQNFLGCKAIAAALDPCGEG